ncbi:MAG: hypothetical protein IPP47_07950 [Bryobacterales bacterium]|nr:hypothetical protein [Bryobacterales bacterium]
MHDNGPPDGGIGDPQGIALSGNAPFHSSTSGPISGASILRQFRATTLSAN